MGIFSLIYCVCLICFLIARPKLGELTSIFSIIGLSCFVAQMFDLLIYILKFFGILL